MDPIPAQDGRAARGDPHSGQLVAEDLVLLDQALAALVHVDAAVLAVVDPVVAHDRTALSADLDAGQLVAWQRRATRPSAGYREQSVYIDGMMRAGENQKIKFAAIGNTPLALHIFKRSS